VTAIRTLIVDDEPLARERVRELLEGESDVEIVGEAANGVEALTMILSEAPQLVFLDVQMPELDGFGLLRELGSEGLPVIVFVTAYDEYALQAFDVHAVDYLLKPFDRQRFCRSLARARDLLTGRDRNELDRRLQSLLEDLRPGERHLERILVKAGGKIRLVRVEELDYVEAAGNYLRLYQGRERHLLRETLSNFETRLDPARFVRIHRSIIVNLDRVAELEQALHGDYHVRLHDGRRLTLTRTYREHFQAVLGREL